MSVSNGVEVRLGEAFVQGILNGEFDFELDSINGAVHMRRRALSMAEASAIRVGDRVRIKSIKPKYLMGAEGVVENKDADWITVKIDSRFYTGRYSHTLRCPHSSLERVMVGSV